MVLLQDQEGTQLNINKDKKNMVLIIRKYNFHSKKISCVLILLKYELYELFYTEIFQIYGMLFLSV